VGIETRVGQLLWDEPGGYLFTAQVVSGVQAARARTRRSYGTCEGVASEWTPGCGGEREHSKRQNPQGAEYRLRGTLADLLVVAVKPGNAGGAKGRGCSG
jgi:hypothetical protein